ncbi:LysR substrate-binding domain-containing protein [Terrarubrum flagellatum]|uniref:LysR substrate-binding domain-containing protein n=1 Tax=Terrirubrum flagellatum TaxID=2895980 RepID=UPI00314523E6
MARKLPPFAALRAFEALARNGSLAATAEELLISPSAVSHQVKALEVFVGAKLLIRGASGMKLTEPGRALFAGLVEALDKIEASTMGVADYREAGSLTVHLYHSLAQLWLIPQLSEFLDSNPGLAVTCVTKPEEVDFSGSTVDVAIRYARERPAEPLAEKLIDEVIYPVVSPGYLRSSGPIETPQDLIGKRLIGCEHQIQEWAYWFEAVGIDPANGRPQIVFDTRNQALQAAAEGIGVAINRRPSGDLMMQRGILVAPVDMRIATGMAYYIIAPQRSATSPRVKLFSAWLASISAGLRDEAAHK